MFNELHDRYTFDDDEVIDRDGESLWDAQVARVSPEFAAAVAKDPGGMAAIRARTEYGRRFRTIRCLLRQHDLEDTEQAAQEWLVAFDGVLVDGVVEGAQDLLGEIHEWIAAGWSDGFRAQCAKRLCRSPEAALLLLAQAALTVEYACSAPEFAVGGDGWKAL